MTNKAGMVGGLLIRLSFEWIGSAGRWWVLYRFCCVGRAKTVGVWEVAGGWRWGQGEAGEGAYLMKKLFGVSKG